MSIIKNYFISNKKLLFFLIFFLILLISHAPALFKKPLWDDVSFIFQNISITLNKNPFIFWIKESDHYKNWPIGYSIFWVLYRLFKENFTLWTLLAITLHSLNGLMFYKILKDEKVRYAFLATFIFILHPLHVETISWTIQLNTLFGVFFTMVSYIFLRKHFLTWNIKRRWIYFACSMLFLVISLKIKPVAILLPFVVFIGVLRSNHKLFIRRVKVFIPLAVIACFYVWKSMTGIHHSNYELSMSKVYVVDKVLAYKTPLELLEFDFNSGVYESEQDFNERLREYESHRNNALNPRGTLGRYLLKLNLMSDNLVFYVTKFVFPFNQMLFYPKPEFWMLNVFLTCFVVGVSVCLVIVTYLGDAYKNKENKPIFLGCALFLAGFLPISGLAYIPFMKFAFVADHWGYVGLMGCSLVTVGLVNKFIKSKNVALILLIFFVTVFGIRTSFYSKLFNDHKKLLHHNISQNPTNEFLYKYLGKLYMDDGYNDQARSYFLKTLELSPGDRFAKRKLKQINNESLIFAEELENDHLDLYDHHSEPR